MHSFLRRHQVATLAWLLLGTLLACICFGPDPPVYSAASLSKLTLVGANVAGPIAPDGTEIQCDLPASQHLKNIGGSDGAGLCVFTSISHQARWQGVDVLANFRNWMHSKPGGGYPEKVDAMIQRICKEKQATVPNYIQVEGDDLETLNLALKTGRMPCVTYSFSPSGRYGGQRIAHMVNLAHLDSKWAAVLDNNFPGTYEWMTPAEFQKTYAPGWAVILLDAPPPPIPHNSNR